VSVEALEQRLQLSATSFVDGVLQITLSGEESLRVTERQGEVILVAHGQKQAIGTLASAVTELIVQGDGNENRIDLSRIFARRFPNLTTIQVNGGPGDDTILGSRLADNLRGGDGHDRIDGGHGADSIFGDAGNDRLLGRIGNDWIFEY
jgi:hypothetical protein